LTGKQNVTSQRKMVSVCVISRILEKLQAFTLQGG